MSDAHLPIPVRASKQRVHAFAERAASRLGYNAGGSIHDLVGRLGGVIEHSDPFEEGPPESIFVRARGDFTVLISSLTSPDRDRFTIAHELGHYILHFPKVQDRYPNEPMKATRWVDESDETQRRAEWEANWFAAGFLMPEAEFRSVFQGNLDAVAKHFGVSRSAAGVRANSLGLS